MMSILITQNKQRRLMEDYICATYCNQYYMYNIWSTYYDVDMTFRNHTNEISLDIATKGGIFLCIVEYLSLPKCDI